MLAQAEPASLDPEVGADQLEFDDEINEAGAFRQQGISGGLEQQAVEFQIHGEDLADGRPPVGQQFLGAAAVAGESGRRKRAGWPLEQAAQAPSNKHSNVPLTCGVPKKVRPVESDRHWIPAGIEP